MPQTITSQVSPQVNIFFSISTFSSGQTSRHRHVKSNLLTLLTNLNSNLSHSIKDGIHVNFSFFSGIFLSTSSSLIVIHSFQSQPMRMQLSWRQTNERPGQWSAVCLPSYDDCCGVTNVSIQCPALSGETQMIIIYPGNNTAWSHHGAHHVTWHHRPDLWSLKDNGHAANQDSFKCPSYYCLATTESITQSLYVVNFHLISPLDILHSSWDNSPLRMMMMQCLTIKWS